jgi:hypothetical protein
MLFTKGKKFKISCVAMTLAFVMLLSSIVVLPVSAGTTYESVVQSKNLVFGSPYSGTANDCKYTFTLQQSGRVSIACDNLGGGYSWNNMYVQIYDSVNSCFLKFGIGEKSSASTYVDLLAGQYALYIYHAQDNVNYSFTANFTSAGETTSETDMSKNDSIATATSYKLGKKVNAQLACNDEQDVYKFTVSKAGYVNLTLTNNLKSVDFSIIDGVGEISYSMSNVGMGKNKYKYFVTEGTYYLTVKRKSTDTGYTGAYTISTSYSAIPKPTLKTAKNVSKKSLKLTWSKKSGITGYQVQIATSKNFKKGKKTYTYEGNTIGNAKIKKLKKKTTYYVRVRTYVSAGNGQKYYSAWSSVKKVTIKK